MPIEEHDVNDTGYVALLQHYELGAVREPVGIAISMSLVRLVGGTATDAVTQVTVGVERDEAIALGRAILKAAKAIK